MFRGLVLLALTACGEIDSLPPVDFGVRLVPGSMRALVGQRCVVLVQTTLPPTLRSATISAIVDAPFNLVGRELPGGAVSEIEVDPDGAVDRVGVFAHGEYQGESADAGALIEVVGGVDHLGAEGRARLELFLPYLEESYPDEGIGVTTRWIGAPVVSGGEVARYLFFSARWEVGLAWRDDWTRLYLRRRFAGLRPSMAFRLRSMESEPVPCVPPPAVDR